MIPVVMLVAAAVCSVTNAQTVDNSVQLRLRLVEITPHPADPTQTLTRAATANTGTGVFLGADPASRTRTFEVQYSLSDGNGTTHPAGLVSGTLNITGAAGVTYSQALLTNLQARTGGASALPLGGTDTSGPATGPLAGAAGMERPFRGGFSTAGNNADPANGTVVPSGIISIVPLAISQTLSSPITNQWFAIYEFNVLIPLIYLPPQYTIAAALQPDPGTGAAFGFFNDGVATPVTSTNALGAGVTFSVFFPSPGVLTVLLASGLACAGRQRRPGSV